MFGVFKELLIKCLEGETATVVLGKCNLTG